MNPGRFLGRASRLAARHALHRWLPLTGDQCIVSMTFDDILASAASTGARILEEHGCRGTFYVAGSLTAGIEAGRPTHTLQDLHELHAKGHEIGSHGWSHIDYSRCSSKARAQDLQANIDFLRSHLDLPEHLHFAYPFGQYGVASKWLTRSICGSSRALGNGLHHGHADLDLLGCQRFYGAGRARTLWEPLIQAMQPGSWLIVSTHEVEENCGDYGCTPEDLRSFIKSAQRHQCRILPIGEAIGYWSRATTTPREDG